MGFTQFSHGRVRLKHILVASFLVATVYWLRLGRSNPPPGLSPTTHTPATGQPVGEAADNAAANELAQQQPPKPVAHEKPRPKTPDDFPIFQHFDPNTIRGFLENPETAGWIEGQKAKGLSGEDAAHEGGRLILEGMRGGGLIGSPVEKQIRHLFEVEQKARQRSVHAPRNPRDIRTP